MISALRTLRRERRAQVMLGTVAQSSLGTGAGYVALLLIAYDRWHSPWAISLILFAEFAASMVLSPIFGTLADRWSKRGLVVGADVLRAVCFAGVAVVGSFEATLALAMLAGAGSAMFRPAMLSALPGLVGKPALTATTSVYGAVTDAGFTVGPALAAGVLAIASPSALLVANGITFLISAAVLSKLRFASMPAAPASEAPPSIVSETVDGVRALRGQPAVAVVVGATAAAMFSGGIFNVIELPFAEGPLDAGEVGYAALAAVYGFGFLAGSLGGAAGGEDDLLKRRFLLGLLITGAGGLSAAVSPTLLAGLFAFALAGCGNGIFVTHQRLLVQAEVGEDTQGRVFGLIDAATSWALGLALLSGGVLADLASTRVLMGATGLWDVTTCIVTSVLLASVGAGVVTRRKRHSSA